MVETDGVWTPESSNLSLSCASLFGRFGDHFQEHAHELDKTQSLAAPLVRPIHLLPALDNSYRFLWMLENVLHLCREIISITQFKKD